MRRRGLVAVGLSIAAFSAVTTVGGVSATEDGTAIALDDSSRFEFAVAGTIQLPDTSGTPAGAASTTVVPRGSTVVLTEPAGPSTTERAGPSTTASARIVNGGTPQGRRGLAALDAIGFPWQDALDGWTITFLPGRSGRSGLVDFQQREITIYVRDSHTATKLAHVVAHEIGHVVDWRFVTDAERIEWINARGLGNRSWYPTRGAFDFASPAGDFAEAFAEWQVGGGNYSQIGGRITQSDVELLERITGQG